jgi:hypothetical protein
MSNFNFDYSSLRYFPKVGNMCVMEREEEEEQLALPVDIRMDIFQNSMQDSRFQAWMQKHPRWQLCISGGPGSGKVSH